VLVAHNIEHQVYGDLLQRSNNIVARWVLQREQHLLSRLDEAALRDIGMIACLTETDKAYYVGLARQIGVSAAVEVLPSHFDDGLGAAPQSKVVNPRSAGPWRIGILGTWTWESNHLGVEWFLREVLPHIDGECEVVIAGRGLEADQLPARVRYLGFVDSAEQFYRSSDVIAIPSTAGGGVQEKTIEAIGYGVPVVATAVAVRGIQPCPSHVQVVSTSREFGAACSRRQGFDAVRVQAAASVWNAERRLRYVSAIDKLLADVTHRTCARDCSRPDGLKI
jgi:glycosyltransferase involved in cell wall biosynthesis